VITRAISVSGPLILIWAIACGGQVRPPEANPCPGRSQQEAALIPAPAVQPVQPEKPPPRSPVAYQSLSKSEKFKVFVRYTYSPYTFAGTAFDAGLAQATAAWRSYGGGMEGYGKRFGASLADNESGAFFGRFLFPVLLREDPRYLRSTSQKTVHRIGYAVSRVLVTRGDNGNERPNLALMLSAFAAAGLANTYYPREERGLADTAARAGADLLSTASMNLLREFWPDIRQKLKRHEPKAIQKLEQSPPVNKIQQMMMGPTAPPHCPPAESHPQTANH
jgi:hypothetical protein